MQLDNDTIVALATPPGRSAIAIVRLSGKNTFKVFHKIIESADIEKLQHRQSVVLNLYRFDVKNGKKDFLDTSMVLPFVAPHSYSGEDLLEIYSHGGYAVPQLIIQALLEAGARMANPGEFTQRAFLNGKLDILQAESVEAIVSASSRVELAFAHQHYSGQFSREIKQLRSELIDLLSLLELELDFSDEDVEFADRNEILNRLHALKNLLRKLLISYDQTHLIREGISVAIVGRPNVGKSSLLNLLLKKERAIVTEIPGTTRDVIEESIEIEGFKFVFIDTAGIRDVSDVVEQEGIRRSRSVIENASAVLLLIDQNSNLHKEDWEIRQLVLGRENNPGFPPIVLSNKSDLPTVVNEKEFEAFCKGFKKLAFSCKTGENLSELKGALREIAMLCFGDLKAETSVLINLRQKDAVFSALRSIDHSIDNFQQNLSQEFIAAELHQALKYLGELIGEVTTEEILGNIFSKFCIGK
jgi:tRNA modification GTPase